MDAKKFYAIIVAGGSGKRMESQTPKQFLTLRDLPVLMHTITAFANNVYQPEIILVISSKDLKYWNDLKQKHQFKIPHHTVSGGSERFYSVKNGLALIDDLTAIVTIHDAVRPLVSQITISRCFDTALSKGNAIAAVPAKDSIRQLVHGKSKALNRNEIYLVQTPQTFEMSQLNNAYEQDFDPTFTDDASVVEKAGYIINLEAGDEFNFKITFPQDLELAETILSRKI